MAYVYVNMSGEDESETKCRKTRRKRIEIRRVATFSGEPSTAGSPRRPEKRSEAGTSENLSADKRSRTTTGNADPPSQTLPIISSMSSSSTSSDGGEEFPVIASSSAQPPAVDSPIAFGSVSLSGRAREMEDAVSVRPEFLRPLDGCPPLHFFAVFDGHGGSHVSELCKERMHSILAEELAAAPDAAAEPAAEVGGSRWRSAVERSFARMDRLALSACACGRVGEPLCQCERSGIESDIVGSTAVVSIVGRDRLLVANCGDSRAVLSRGGEALPLSTDHKPDRPDELARIEATGGRVIYVNGARVHGILAMSRALGDKYLKPVVISAPEIVDLERTPEDECLIIASDGLWDVLPNELACNVARRCLSEGMGDTKDLSSSISTAEGGSGNEKEQTPESRCSMAAALLARLALGRRSTDNISVIVVDLRRDRSRGMDLVGGRKSLI